MSLPAKAQKSPEARSRRRLRITSGEPAHLLRLGVVYAHPLRLTIVTELYMREMSVREFSDEIGGASYNSIRKHFQKLFEYGWIRKVRDEGHKGPGRPERVYRATELAVIDEETWALIPVSIRDAFTLQLLEQLNERFALASTANMLAEGENHFSLSTFRTDETGWRKGLQIILECFRSLEHEQTDAKERLKRSGDSPNVMVVALAGFESPRVGATADLHELPPADSSITEATPWTMRLAKVLGDPVSLEIVRELNGASKSATQLQAGIGDFSLWAVDRRCKTLAELGWIVRLHEKPEGHTSRSNEILYRATSPPTSPAEALASIPDRARRGQSWSIYKKLCEEIVEAVKKGTLNRRVERHLTWQPLMLDGAGRQQVVAHLRTSERLLFQTKQRALRQVSAKNPEMNATFFLGGFEAPSIPM